MLKEEDKTAIQGWVVKKVGALKEAHIHFYPNDLIASWGIAFEIVEEMFPEVHDKRYDEAFEFAMECLAKSPEMFQSHKVSRRDKP